MRVAADAACDGVFSATDREKTCTAASAPRDHLLHDLDRVVTHDANIGEALPVDQP
jgi:hypothetical protein